MVPTKLQLVACTKSSIDSLEHQGAMMSLTLSLKAVSVMSTVTALPSDSSRAENHHNSLNKATHIIIGDSTVNLLWRMKSGHDLDFHCAWKAPHTNMIIHPGSCASPLAKRNALQSSTRVNLRGGDTLSLCRSANNYRADCLNLNSCTSGLNVREPLGLPPLSTPSMISTARSITKKSSHDSIALLFGNHLLLKGLSFSSRCGVGSRNNASNGDNCCTQAQGSTNRNADWGVL